MNIIRLGDRIESRRPSEIDRPYRIADNLAKRVFSVSQEHGDLLEYYIQSCPIKSRPDSMDDLPEYAPSLGEFEIQLIGKLLKPTGPVFCIVGPMGCGKSTTIRYVMRLLKDRAHCREMCSAHHGRLIAHVDFNRQTELADGITKSVERLHRIMCQELRARLRYPKHLTYEEERTKFWQRELKRYAQGATSKAFRTIIANWEGEDIQAVDFTDLSEEQKQEQTRVLDIVKQEKGVYFDYLVRLWEYVIQVYFGGNHGCAFIVLDNLDRIDPYYQREIVQFVYANARTDGPTFVLLVRPETFDYSGLGTGVPDDVNHRGPEPKDVVLDRLQRFCDDPKSFTDSWDGLNAEEFELLETFISQIQHLIDTDSHQTFVKFLKASCGKSIRAALRMAQNLFRVSVADMEGNRVSIHDVIRTCVNTGESQLRWKRLDIIQHLFRISSGEQGGWLLKPRILRYLRTQERSRRRVSEINNVMKGFGYDNSSIREAINDMMGIDSQLVRSNGFDVFYDGEEIQKYKWNKIVLTEIGEGYAKHLIGDVDYIQEVMLDTYVDGDKFPPRIDYGYLSEKFRLLFLFLKEIHSIDCEETEQFLETLGPGAYRKAFGDRLISLDMMQGIYPSVKRILSSVFDRRSSEQTRHEYQGLVEDFRSLAIEIENANKYLLGTSAHVMQDAEAPAVQG